MKRLGIFLALAITLPVLAQSKTVGSHGPDCSGGWPTNMAFVHLKNEGITTNDKIDFSKTNYVRFTEKSGNSIEAIAVHDASPEECSMTGVEVFVVSKHLNPERQ